MDTFARFWLRAKLAFRVPTVIEKDEHGSNVAGRCYWEKVVYSRFERLGVLLPKQGVDENPDNGESKPLGKS
jgi:hypothetical protein